MFTQPDFIKDRKIRIAIVGCGKIATNHIDAIRFHNNDFEIVGVCDSSAAGLERVTTELKVPGYQNINDLIIATNPDVITLCTPSGLHASQTLEIAAHGKHVITEKPMATRFSDAQDMIKACDKAGVFLFVVKQNRFNPVVRALKEAIAANRFGRIYLVNLNVFWTRPQSYYDQASWRGTWELDGGAFMNQASHYVDLLDWLIGPIESVQAMMGTLGRKVEVEDTGVLNIRWRCGAMGSMNVTMLTYPKNFESTITILGENGTVRIGGNSLGTIQHWEFAQAHETDELSRIAATQNDAANTGHVPYYHNIAKSLRGEEKPAVDGREGLRSLEILTAAYLASRDNMSVSLPMSV